MAEAQVRVGMPLDEFLEAVHNEPFELIDGERVPKMPNVAVHSYVIQKLYEILLIFLLRENIGKAFIETTFVRPDAYDRNWVRGSRIPDILFYSLDRLNAYYEENPDWQQRPYALVPDLVIEVVSPNDKYSELNRKLDKYREDDVPLIWVIDPQQRKALVYTRDADYPVEVRGADSLDGADILPGFDVKLADLLPDEEE